MYPCYKKASISSLVVYFTKRNCGTVVKERDRDVGLLNYKIGEYRDDWIESNFSKIKYVTKIKY